MSTPSTVRFGRSELPEPQERALRRAVRLEWVTLGTLAVTATLVALVLGNSQAMKAAWVEDLLSLLPPLAFLIAVRVARRPPSPAWPYGRHRSLGVAHLVAAVALTGMGLYLIVDSATGLVTAEHPPIGIVVLAGQPIWLGWLMIAVMVVTSIPPVILGRAKMRLGRELHDKVLYADAQMNRADWMTALATVAGVSGIGLGLWWADAAAALFVSGSIVHDGIRNLRGAVRDLMDGRATTFDDRRPHPVVAEVRRRLASLPWVAAVGTRARDQGHVFHVEAFVVPTGPVRVEELQRVQQECAELDWRLRDVVVVPVATLPPDLDVS